MLKISSALHHPILLKHAEQLLRCQALIPFNCNAFLSFDYFTG